MPIRRLNGMTVIACMLLSSSHDYHSAGIPNGLKEVASASLNGRKNLVLCRAKKPENTNLLFCSLHSAILVQVELTILI